MASLANAIKRARAKKSGVDVSEDLERTLLSLSRKRVRSDRARIKKGLTTKEEAKERADVAAVDDYLEQINAELEKLT